MTDIDYQWIASDVQLLRLCEQLEQQTVLALDTEFIRTRTYYPHIGLLQIADAHGVYLIDPLPLRNVSPLANILQNPNITKVVHACSEDLEVFQHYLGVLPAALFDTQIAAAFCGYGAFIGYANLLRAVKDIDIAKQETRSDWLQRPLSDAQLRYAALDVLHLIEIYQKLFGELEVLQRLSWVEAECVAVVNKLRNVNHEKNYYQRIKSAWKLKPKQLAVLKKLCAWREQQAQEKDMPRGRVIKDSSIWEMALHLPSTIEQLKRTKDIYGALIENSGEQLLVLIDVTISDAEQYPPMLPKPMELEQRNIIKQLKQYVSDVAEQLNMPAEILVRKKDYEALLLSKNNRSSQYSLPISLQDWRQSVVGDGLLTQLNALS